MKLDCAGKTLDLSIPRVMGVLNVTPDSFFDGGRFVRFDAALKRAEAMIQEGVDIIDVGGESTRPDAKIVSDSEELDRVIPIVEQLVANFDVPVSIDTSKPAVMRDAVQAGAGMINDVRALQVPGALEIAAAAPVPICLMHMQGNPRTMQQAPHYEDVVDEVSRFLSERIVACENAGIPKQRLLIDPGFGFGKSLEHNLALLGKLNDLIALDVPLLVGISRKSMLGTILAQRRNQHKMVMVQDRLFASVGAAVVAAMHGARIIRVHDVRETVEALAPFSSILQGTT